MTDDPTAIGPEASPEGASVDPDRSKLISSGDVTFDERRAMMCNAASVAGRTHPALVPNSGQEPVEASPRPGRISAAVGRDVKSSRVPVCVAIAASRFASP
jgi:hypothetical protein